MPASRAELPPVKASQIPETAGRNICLLEKVGDRICRLEIVWELEPKKLEKVGALKDKKEIHVNEELLKDAREKDNEGFKFWGIAIFIETFELGGRW